MTSRQGPPFPTPPLAGQAQGPHASALTLRSHRTAVGSGPWPVATVTHGSGGREGWRPAKAGERPGSEGSVLSLQSAMAPLRSERLRVRETQKAERRP